VRECPGGKPGRGVKAEGGIKRSPEVGRGMRARVLPHHRPTWIFLKGLSQLRQRTRARKNRRRNFPVRSFRRTRATQVGARLSKRFHPGLCLSIWAKRAQRIVNRH